MPLISGVPSITKVSAPTAYTDTGSNNPYKAEKPKKTPPKPGNLTSTMAGIFPSGSLYIGNIPMTDTGSNENPIATGYSGSGNLMTIEGLTPGSDQGGDSDSPSVGYASPSSYNQGGGGGGNQQAAKIEWKQTYEATDAPSWWKGMTPVGGMNSVAGYASIMNALIPYMSPEDQRTYAQNLARLVPEAFGSYGDIEQLNFELPTDVTPEMRQYYTGADRAQEIQNTLQRMVNTSPSSDTFNVDTLGPGYTYFQNLAQVLEDFGGTQTPASTGTSRDAKYDRGQWNVPIPSSNNPQTRQQYTQLQAALDPLLSETNQDSLAAFGPAAQSLAMPFFSAEDLVPVRKLSDGRWVFGQPQGSWY